MITWDYRIVQRADGGFALHEVHYAEDGSVRSLTAEPVGFVADAEEGASALIDALAQALDDARRRPVLARAELPAEEGA